MAGQSYDAVLILSFGGPEQPDDVIPFLENVLRGRNVPRERMLEVAEHYYHFGGKSPINEQNRALIAGLQRRVASATARTFPSIGAIATGIRLSPTRCARCKRMASGARWLSPLRCSAPTRDAGSISKTSRRRARKWAPARLRSTSCGRSTIIRCSLKRSRIGFARRWIKSPAAQVLFTAHSVPLGDVRDQRI